MTGPLLVVDRVVAGYGKSEVLHGTSLVVDRGEAISLMGRNGMGKTTLLRTIAGLIRPSSGDIAFDGRSIARMQPDAIARDGVAFVPADRGIFSLLSVDENLGVSLRKGGWTKERIYDRFPRLAERRRNPGGALSGGEQQMLAIARALAQGPRLMLLDEPTEGLAPVIVQSLVDIIREIVGGGTTIVLVEQTYAVCRALASRHYILEEGQIVYEGTSAELDANARPLEAFLGV